MNAEQLMELMDEKDVGDPALVPDLTIEVESFLDDLDELPADTALYLVAVASLFSDGVSAYRLLRRCLPLLESRGPLRELYRQQLAVWRGRKDKRQHDLEYLRIVLGVRELRPDEDEPRTVRTEEVRHGFSEDIPEE